jgi:hypothetical protein
VEVGCCLHACAVEAQAATAAAGSTLSVERGGAGECAGCAERVEVQDTEVQVMCV